MTEVGDVKGEADSSSGLSGPDYKTVNDDITAKDQINQYTCKTNFLSLNTLISPFKTPGPRPQHNKSDKTTEFTKTLNEFENMTRTQRAFLQKHKDLGHIGFEEIRELARQGELPKEFITVESPACAACMYARATRRPWRTKTRKNDVLVKDKPLNPGNCVAVDMMLSPTPGIIAQLTGRLTKR